MEKECVDKSNREDIEFVCICQDKSGCNCKNDPDDHYDLNINQKIAQSV